jgi:hypothetical protein
MADEKLIALHTVLKSGREMKYDAVHERVPAELSPPCGRTGVADWRIRRDGRHAFHLVTVRDYRPMHAGLRDLPVNDYIGADDGGLTPSARCLAAPQVTSRHPMYEDRFPTSR